MMKSKNEKTVMQEGLGIAEVAQLLGVSVGHVRKMMRAGKIPYRKLGARYLFSRRQILEWLGTATTELDQNEK